METKRIVIKISKETLEDMKQTCAKIRNEKKVYYYRDADVAKMLAWLSTIIVKAEEA